MLMRRYLHQYGYDADAFAPFPVNAHANGTANKGALYRFPINADKYRKATMIASPLNMLDCSSAADGAAAVLLASERVARELSGPAVRIAGSALAVDTLALHGRRDPLHLAAAQRSAAGALNMARMTTADMNVLELTDPHGIAAALALESCGFVPTGEAPRYAADGGIAPTGATPLATAGGYKARGDLGGASGVYQAVELVRQLHGVAGAAQVPGARVAFAQCLGGIGATAVTHVLVRES
jgi:acetyl-CoA C-acetyltransferase